MCLHVFCWCMRTNLKRFFFFYVRAHAGHRRVCIAGVRAYMCLHACAHVRSWQASPSLALRHLPRLPPRSLADVKSQLGFVYSETKCLHLCQEAARQRCSTPTLILQSVMRYYDIPSSSASSAARAVYLLRLR